MCIYDGFHGNGKKFLNFLDAWPVLIADVLLFIIVPMYIFSKDKSNTKITDIVKPHTFNK